MSKRISKTATVKTVETLNPVSGEVTTVAIDAPTTPAENNLDRLTAKQNAANQNTQIVPVNGALRMVRKVTTGYISNTVTQSALVLWSSEFSGNAVGALKQLRNVPGLRREGMTAQRTDGVDYLYTLYSSPWTTTDKTGESKATKRYYLLTIDSEFNISLEGMDEVEIASDGSPVVVKYNPMKRSELLSDIQMIGNIDPDTITAKLTGSGWKIQDKAKTVTQLFSDARGRHDEPNLK